MLGVLNLESSALTIRPICLPHAPFRLLIIHIEYSEEFFSLLVLYCYLFNFRPVSCNLQTLRSPPGVQTAASFAKIQLPLQKLLFSATMTHSPEKLAPLQLYQPILFTATGSVNQTSDAGESVAGMRCLCYFFLQENGHSKHSSSTFLTPGVCDSNKNIANCQHRMGGSP